MKKLRKLSKEYYLRQIIACWMIFSMAVVMPVQIAMAVETPGADVLPSGIINSTGINAPVIDGLNMDITQTAGEAIINWNNFDIGADAGVKFIQPGSAAAVLNRVHDGDVTGIMGSLTANGRVFIINPAGMVFGEGAVVNVSQLVASSLDITDDDFMNGIYKFAGGSGMVANYGQISAEQVALIGRKVLNAGVIQAPAGCVIMAAGDKVFLGVEGSDVVVEVTGITLPDAADAEFKDGDVINEGTIEASGGKIVLAAGDTFSRALEGLDSRTVAVDAGTGRVGQFGTLNADGIDGDGGSITLTAGDVVTLGNDSVTTANAGTNGDGGDIIAYSPKAALLGPTATVEAKGGAESGDGGFFELSGKEYVDVLGTVDTTAPHGSTGSFLIDPTNITISDAASSSTMWWYDNPYWSFSDAFSWTSPSNLNIGILTGQLASTNVEVSTFSLFNWFDSGWIQVLDPIAYNSNNLLTMTADNYIWTDVDAAITNSGIGGLKMHAQKGITTNAEINLNGGHLEMLGGQKGPGFFSSGAADININADITAGSIRIKNGKDVPPGEQSYSGVYLADGKTLTSSDGDVVVEAVHDIVLLGDVTANGGDIFLNADEDGYGDPKGEVYNPQHYGGGDLIAKNLTADGKIDLRGNAIQLNGNVTAGDGDLTITGRSSADSAGETLLDPGSAWGNVGVAEGKTLSASDDVVVSSANGDMELIGDHLLTIQAGTDADDRIILNGTTIEVVGSELVMKQGASIDNFLLDSVVAKGNTELALVSYTGSVTDYKADEWQTIGAIAKKNITLTGDGTINLGKVKGTNKSLWAKDGFVDVASFNGAIKATDRIKAGTNVTLDAHSNVKLDKLAQAGDAMLIKAGNNINTQALKSGWSMTIDADNNVTIGALADAGRVMDIKAGNNINTQALKSGRNMDIDAGNNVAIHALADAGWEMKIDAYNIHTMNLKAGRSIDLDAGDTIHLHGNARAGDDILLHSQTVADNGVTLDAGRDVKAFDSLIGKGSLTVEAGHDVIAYAELETEGNMTVHADNDIDLQNIPMSAYSGGTMELLANYDGVDQGNLTAAGNLEGNMSLGGYDVVVEGKVKSHGTLTVDADHDIKLKRKVSSANNMTMTAGRNIKLNAVGGTTQSNGRMDLTAGKNIVANKYLRSSRGMALEADNDITLEGDVHAATDGQGNLRIKADADQSWVGKVLAKGEIETFNDAGGKGNITIRGQKVTLKEKVKSAHDLMIIARQGGSDTGDSDVIALGKLKSAGSMTVHAADDIDLQHTEISAKSVGTMELIANYDGGSIGNLDVAGSLEGNMTLGGVDVDVVGTVTSHGTLDVTASNNIKLRSNVWSAGDMTMTAGNNIKLNKDSGNTVSAGAMDLKAGNNIEAFGKLRTTNAANGDMTVKAKNDILLHNLDMSAKSAGRMKMVADKNGDLNGDLLVDGSLKSGHNMTLEGFDVIVKGTVTSDNKLDVAATNDIKLKSDVFSANDMTMNADNNIKLNKDSGMTTSMADMELIAGKNIDAFAALRSHGTMTAEADKHITLNGQHPDFGSAMSDGDMVLHANANDNDKGDMTAHGDLTSVHDDVDIYSSDSTTNLYGNVYADIDDDGDITLHNDARVAHGVLLKAGDDVTAWGTVTGAGDLTIEAGIIGPGSAGDYANVLLDKWVKVDGDLAITAGDDITANGKLTSNGFVNTGSMTLNAGDDIKLNAMPASAQSAGLMQIEADLDSRNGTGNVDVAGSLEGNMKLTGTNVYVDGTVYSHGSLRVDADDDIKLKSNVYSADDMVMEAVGGDIELNAWSGDTTSGKNMTLTAGDDITIGKAYSGEGNVNANGNMRIWAGDGWNDDVTVYGKLTTTNGGNINVQAGDDITVWGTWNGPTYESVDADGMLTMKANTSGIGIFGGNLYIAGDAIADSMQLEAGAGGPPDYSDSHVQVDGSLQTTGGDMVIEAHHDILLGGNVNSAGNLVLNADRHGDYGYSDPHAFGGDVEVAGTVDAVGTIDMYGNNIRLEEYVMSGGDMTLTGNTSEDFAGGPVGDVIAMGDLTSTGGSIEITSDDTTTYLGGNVWALNNVTLNNDTKFTSTVDQRVTADTGSITASGYLEKVSFLFENEPLESSGSLYLLANENISLKEHVTVEKGGISIISETGKIFTPDALGNETDTLNVNITGYSDHKLSIGVVLPKDYDDPAPDAAGKYETGLAAIVIMSEKALKLGPRGTLTAEGKYYTGETDEFGNAIVDDRPGVDFANYDRDGKPGGDPIDIAIYLASNSREPVDLPTYDYEGDVHVGSPVDLLPPGAVMVVDAYDTVTFGEAFENSLRNGNVDWLEVCSRISPTFEFAWYNDKLPKSVDEVTGVDKGWELDKYVWRGEGGGNDGGAWVLKPVITADPRTQFMASTIEGCPLLVQAAAAELGITAETIQVGTGNAIALNPSIQACQACATLVDAAAILRDEDGSRMAAMAQMFNVLAPADAPFTPATAASIAMAFEGAAEGSQYASAMEYIDAFVQYVAVLDVELGSPVGDSVAFVMEKHGAGITGSDNANIAAFVAMRLEAIGG